MRVILSGLLLLGVGCPSTEAPLPASVIFFLTFQRFGDLWKGARAPS